MNQVIEYMDMLPLGSKTVALYNALEKAADLKRKYGITFAGENTQATKQRLVTTKTRKDRHSMPVSKKEKSNAFQAMKRRSRKTGGRRMKRRKGRTFGGTRGPVMTNKYNPTKTKGAIRKKKGVSKSFYRKVHKAIDGTKTQAITFVRDDVSIGITGYDETLKTGGQSTVIFNLGGINGALDEDNVGRLFSGQLAQDHTVGAFPSGPKTLGEEQFIRFHSMVTDMTILNTSDKIMDIDIYEMICTKDLPGNFNTQLATEIPGYNQFYDKRLLNIEPPREGLVTNRIPDATYGFAEGYVSTFKQVGSGTLGITPYHNYLFGQYFKVTRSSKLFLEPASATHLKYAYKLNKKLKGQDVWNLQAKAGFTRLFVFVVNAIDRSTVASAINVRQNSTYWYSDPQQKTSTLGISTI